MVQSHIALLLPVRCCEVLIVSFHSTGNPSSWSLLIIWIFEKRFKLEITCCVFLLSCELNLLGGFLQVKFIEIAHKANKSIWKHNKSWNLYSNICIISYEIDQKLGSPVLILTFYFCEWSDSLFDWIAVIVDTCKWGNLLF